MGLSHSFSIQTVAQLFLNNVYKLMQILTQLQMIRVSSSSTNFGRNIFRCKELAFNTPPTTIVKQMTRVKWSIDVWKVISNAWLKNNHILGIIGSHSQNFGTILTIILTSTCLLLKHYMGTLHPFTLLISLGLPYCAHGKPKSSRSNESRKDPS